MFLDKSEVIDVVSIFGCVISDGRRRSICGFKFTGSEAEINEPESES